MELDDYGKRGVREDTSEVDQDVAKQYNDMMDRVDMDRLGKKQVWSSRFSIPTGHQTNTWSYHRSSKGPLPKFGTFRVVP